MKILYYSTRCILSIRSIYSYRNTVLLFGYTIPRYLCGNTKYVPQMSEKEYEETFQQGKHCTTLKKWVFRLYICTCLYIRYYSHSRSRIERAVSINKRIFIRINHRRVHCIVSHLSIQVNKNFEKHQDV